MRVLAVTNLWPTPERPDLGTFMEGQVAGLREIGVDVRVEFVDRAAEGRRAYARLGRRVLDRIESDQPDLVHVLYGGWLAYRVTRAMFRSTPTVVSFCGADLLGERFDGQQLNAALGVRASRQAARRADAVVVKSAELAEALPRGLETPVHVIPNGVDLDRFQPANGDEARRQVGWPEAGLHVMFVAHRQAPSRKRPEMAEGACEAAGALGLDVELHVAAGLDHDTMATWLNAADVLVLTSAQEGSPNVVREALACGTPVVSVPVGDVEEQLRGVQGCHLTAAEPDAIASALARVAARGRRVDARNRLAGRSTVAVARQLETLYREVSEP